MNRNINELQLLRAFGILAVLVHHMEYNLFPWHSVPMDTFYTYFSGTAALDMFFALSGFVITRLLLNDLAPAEDRFHSMQIACIFWLRRAWRLLPAAWFWLAASVVLAIFANETGAFGPVRTAWSGAVTGALQVANLRFGDCMFNYHCGPTFAYWSLSLEEQFYIFLPLLLIFSGKWFFRILLVLALTQMFIEPLILPFYLRMQGFLLGVMLAFWSRNPTYKIYEPTFLSNKAARWFVLCTLLVGMCAMNNKIVPQFMLFQLSALIGAILVFIASFDRCYLWADGWLKTFGLWLGSRAYAMYLCHIPLFFLTREIVQRSLSPDQPLGPDQFWYLLIIGVGLVVICSELTYSLLEKPLRSKGMRISRDMQQRQQAEREAFLAGKAKLID